MKNYGWETTVEDVEAVLKRMGRDQSEAQTLHNRLNLALVEHQVMQSNQFFDQIEAAYDEIERQISESFPKGDTTSTASI